MYLVAMIFIYLLVCIAGFGLGWYIGNILDYFAKRSIKRSTK